jgi:hypothetical protein
MTTTRWGKKSEASQDRRQNPALPVKLGYLWYKMVQNGTFFVPRYVIIH